MHEKLLSSLLRAPMSFYHTTPTGRIINRLTKDTADIDRNLAGNLSFAFRWVRTLLQPHTLASVHCSGGCIMLVMALTVLLRAGGTPDWATAAAAATHN